MKRLSLSVIVCDFVCDFVCGWVGGWVGGCESESDLNSGDIATATSPAMLRVSSGGRFSGGRTDEERGVRGITATSSRLQL
jgi:hypothetical protein